MGYCKNGMNFHTGDSGIEMHCLGVGDFKDYSVIDGTDYLPTISLNEAPPEERMLQDGDMSDPTGINPLLAAVWLSTRAKRQLPIVVSVFATA